MDAVAAYQALRTAEGRRDPFPYYAVLHAHGPVLSLPDSPLYTGVIHGYDAVNQVLRDPGFRVADKDRIARAKPDWHEHPALVAFANSMMFTNGELHTRTRRLITQVFTARRVHALAEAITQLVDDLLDRMLQLGAGGQTVDFMAAFAYQLPSNVIGALLGVPEADRPWFRPHVIAIGGVLDAGIPGKIEAADAAAAELSAYFVDLAARRRAKPQDDLVSTLVQAWDSDLELSEEQLLATLILLFNAGFETTTHLLGNGLSIMLAHPGSMERLREDPQQAGPYVEEFLRLEAPGQLTTRWAAEDAEVHGLKVPAGQDVLVLFGAANRDPRRFPAPEVFDPDRPDNNPLTFSAGPHFCPGAMLSRFEGQIAFSRLVACFPKLAAAGPASHLDQLALRGHTSLPITLS